MRPNLYVTLAWSWVDLTLPELPPIDPPSDLAGFHVEMAGAHLGPWRRVTPQPIAWWETSYRIQNRGVLKYGAPNDLDPQNYSGNTDCAHFRLIAVDEEGNESAPIEPKVVVACTEEGCVFEDAYPLPGCPTTTPPAPTGLVASTETPGQGQPLYCYDCETRLEWNRVEGATEYVIYRYVFPAGLFFYPTHVQPATEDPIQYYVESGDGGYHTPVDANDDCPTSPWYWNWGPAPPIPFSSRNCATGFLEAYFVTARSPDPTGKGGESPRSEIVFWDCCDDPPYASLLGPTPDSEELIAIASAMIPVSPANAEGGVPSSALDDRLGVCDVGEDGYVGTPLSGPTALPLATAPLLTLAGLGDPSFHVYNMHVDHLGSTRLVTDDEGDIVSEHKFLPFGEEILPVRDFSTKMFTGHERDDESGLDYMMARYYSQKTFRFVQPDPVSGTPESPTSFNRYAYVTNNPLNLNDPTGRWPNPDVVKDWPNMLPAPPTMPPSGGGTVVTLVGQLIDKIAQDRMQSQSGKRGESLIEHLERLTSQRMIDHTLLFQQAHGVAKEHVSRVTGQSLGWYGGFEVTRDNDSPSFPPGQYIFYLANNGDFWIFRIVEIDGETVMYIHTRSPDAPPSPPSNCKECNPHDRGKLSLSTGGYIPGIHGRVTYTVDGIRKD